MYATVTNETAATANAGGGCYVQRSSDGNARFSKIQWGDGLTVTPDTDDPNVIRVDGTGGPPAPPALLGYGATGATGATGAAGPGVPTGGTTGQALEKASGTDYDTHWVTLGSTTVAHLDDIGDVAASSPLDEAVLNWDSGAGSWVSRRAILHVDATRKATCSPPPLTTRSRGFPSGRTGRSSPPTRRHGIKWPPLPPPQDPTCSRSCTGRCPSTGQRHVPRSVPRRVVDTFTLTRASLHLETAGSSSTTVLLEKATPSGGVFIATLVATLTLASSATDVAVTTSLGSVSSGDLIRWRWTALGTGAQSFYAQLEGAI